MDGSTTHQHPDPWREAAACLDAEDPDLFFPDRADPAHDALAFCAVCPVLLACRQHALELPERYGVWGGLTESERERHRKASTARRSAHRPSAWVGLSRRRVGA